MNILCTIPETHYHKTECKYRFDPDYNCKWMGNGCKITSKGPCIDVEDQQFLYQIMMREAAAELIKDGLQKRNDLLEAVGFDINQPIDIMEDTENDQVVYMQAKEWE